MDQSTVIAKCRYFRHIGLWPREAEMNYEGWLHNFFPSERELAIALLGQFVYFPEVLTQELFQAAFHGISRKICQKDSNFREAQRSWDDFTNNLILTRVTGETPNDADSGFRFARMSRQRLKISEQQIMPPDKALLEWVNTPSRPIVFVDDFLGSGNQFLETWNRPYYSQSTSSLVSFSDAAKNNPTTCVNYCVPVSTAYGIENLKKYAPCVSVESAHVLTPINSLIGNQSKAWPEHLKPRVEDFIVAASERAGIPKSECFGFHRLGLALAFEHCVPDATLPIFYKETNNWIPLRRRS